MPINGTEKLDLLQRNGVGHYRALLQQRNLCKYTQGAIQFESLIEASKSDSHLAEAFGFLQAAAKARHMRRVVHRLELSWTACWVSAVTHWNSSRLHAPTGLQALARNLML